MKSCRLCKIAFEKTLKFQNKCHKCLTKIANEKKLISIKKSIEKLKSKPKKAIKVKRNLEQEKINKQVRERDENQPCISCNKYIKLEAGHYIPISKSQKLRYDLRNIHGQCGWCNRFLYGNYKEYRIGLINRYGIEFVESLEKDL